MDSSAFSRLPLELREHIYNLVLNRPDNLTISLSAGRPQLQSHNFHIFSLAQTCSQIRSESLSVFYRGSHFVFHTDHITTSHHGYGLRTSWRACLASWLETIGDDHRRRLRSVYIDIEGWDPHPNGLASETLWGSLAPALALFDERTEVALRCYVMYYSLLQQKWKVAPVSISLGDAAMAREAIRRVFRDGVKDGEKHEGQRERECLRLVGFVREREKKIKGIGIEAS